MVMKCASLVNDEIALSGKFTFLGNSIRRSRIAAARLADGWRSGKVKILR